jgi:hypothetical protein
MSNEPDTPVRAFLKAAKISGAKFARILGHRNPTTVQQWKDSGQIPYWRRVEVEEACAKEGIELPADIFRERADSEAA